MHGMGVGCLTEFLLHCRILKTQVLCCVCDLVFTLLAVQLRVIVVAGQLFVRLLRQLEGLAAGGPTAAMHPRLVL